MLLSLSTVPTYLASRGLLAMDRWSNDRCILAPALGRHNNFLIRDALGSGLFIKQIRSETPDLIAAQENEAKILAAIEQQECWGPIRQLIPCVIDIDAARHVLVVQYAKAISFYEAYISVADPASAESIESLSKSIGEAFARFHRCGRQALTDPEHPKIGTSLPIAITLQPPDSDFYSKLSPACRSILAMTRDDQEFLRQLQLNQALWRSTTVIHGDAKWDNILVSDDESSSIHLIDLELSILGDPAWDVAGVLQSFLVYEAELLCSTNAPTFTNQQVNAEAMFRSYLEASTDDPDERFPERVQRFCAARLVQTALEREYVSTSVSTVSLNLIALSRRLLCDSGNAPDFGNAPGAFAGLLIGPSLA